MWSQVSVLLLSDHSSDLIPKEFNVAKCFKEIVIDLANKILLVYKAVKT